MVEMAVVVAVVGVMVLIASMQIDRWQDAEAVKAAARKVEAAFEYARTEATRSGNNQVLFFITDIAGTNLVDGSGDPVDILILDDGLPGSLGQNCTIDANEPIQTVSLEGNVNFGVNASTAKVGIDDGPTSFGGASTFEQTGGGAATWVLFRPDGTPRSANAACALGELGSGGGAIYLSNAQRDVAVVLAPLGSSRVFAWDKIGSTWN